MSLLSDKKIWEAILDATKNRDEKKAERLRKIIKLLCVGWRVKDDRI